MTAAELMDAIAVFDVECAGGKTLRGVMAALETRMQARLSARGEKTYPGRRSPQEVLRQLYQTIRLAGDGSEKEGWKRYTPGFFPERSVPKEAVAYLLVRAAALYDAAAAGRLEGCPGDIDPALLYLCTMDFWRNIQEYARFAELRFQEMWHFPRGTDYKNYTETAEEEYRELL